MSNLHGHYALPPQRHVSAVSAVSAGGYGLWRRMAEEYAVRVRCVLTHARVLCAVRWRSVTVATVAQSATRIESWDQVPDLPPGTILRHTDPELNGLGDRAEGHEAVRPIRCGVPARTSPETLRHCGSARTQ